MPVIKNQKSQIQVRIDARTKQQTKKILEGLGLDISSAVKMFCKQIVNTGSLPLEIRDINGFRSHKARELKEAIVDAEKGKKNFKTSRALIDDALL